MERDTVIETSNGTVPAGSGSTRAEQVRRAAGEHAGRHGRLLRSARDGRILSALMLPLFLLRPPHGYGLLTTTGRRSGKRRRKCIRAVRHGDTAYAVMLRPPAAALKDPSALAAWVWNIRADPHVRLRIGTRTFRALARELTDPAELALARRSLTEPVYLFDYGECDLHLRGLPSAAKIRELHGYWFDTGVPLAIDLLT